MKIIEKDGKKYLVVQEKPEEVLWEIIEELENGKFRVRLSSGAEITVRIGEEEEEIQDYDEYGEPPLPERQEAILQYLFEKNEPVPLKELVNAFAPRFNVSKDTIRLDLEELIKQGLVEKPSRGLYKITDSGLSYFGVRPPRLVYNCAFSSLLEAFEKHNEVEKALKKNDIEEAKKALDELYGVLTDIEFCLKELGRMYQREWGIEVGDD